MRSRFIAAVAFIALFLPLQASALTVSPVRMEFTGDPGQIVNGDFVLLNEQAEARTFYSSFENFEAQGDEGAPHFTPGTEGLATWFTVAPEVTLEAGQQTTVPFSIRIPEDAEPGGHFAAIFWGTTPRSPDSAGQVAVGAKVGILVMLRVSGEIKEGGGLTDFQIPDQPRFFEFLPVTFTYRFQNGGGDRLKPEGAITLRNMLGGTAAILPANPRDGNILPNSSRKFEVLWPASSAPSDESSDPPPGSLRKFVDATRRQWDDFLFGPYKATLDLAYGTQNLTDSSTISLFFFPWQLLSTLLISTLAVLWILFKLIKAYNGWIIRQAGLAVASQKSKAKKRK